MINQIGHSLGRYHILDKLGEGGMAIVYKAYDTHLECEVAVKVIRTEQIIPSTLARALKRFAREAKEVARLDHPNIVSVTDYGEHEGSPYLVMPYIPGGTLKQYLKEKKRLYWQDAARMLIPVAEALDFAHRQKLVHRDVKPSNILLTAEKRPMLTDFGVAKVVDAEVTQDLTGTSAMVGTPEYMAPEQIVSKSVDHRADIYALGVVFFEMVTGRRPYEADTSMAVLLKHASDPLPQPKNLVPDLPDGVESVLLKALAKKPEDRYQTMEAMIVDLKNLRYMDHLPLSKAGSKVDFLHEKEIERRSHPREVSDDFATRDEFTSSPLPQVPITQKDIRSEDRKKVLKYILLLFSGLFVIILGVYFINFGISAINRSKQANSETPSVINTQTFQDPRTQLPLVQEPTFSETLAQISTLNIRPSDFEDEVIQINNINELTEIYRWDRSISLFPFISWEPDSSGFFLASYGYGYDRFDLTSLEMEEFRADMRNIYMSALSPGGLYYATTGTDCNELDIWRHGSNENIYSINGKTGMCGSMPVFSPDGQLLAAAFDDSLGLWNANNGNLIIILDQNLGLSVYGSGELVLAFSNDSRYLAAGKTKTGEIKIWDVVTNTLVSTIHWHEALQSMCFSPDNTTLVSGSFSYSDSDVIRLWDVATGSLINKIHKNNEKIYSIVYTLDGQLILSSSETGAVRAWDLPRGNLVTTIANEGDSVYLISLSPDGNYLVTAGKEVVLYRINTPNK